MPIAFAEITKEEFQIIRRIVTRADALAASLGVRLDRMSLMMDVEATHVGGCPLKLSELYDADDSNFLHDIGGITRHMDRRTGKLGDCFVPRFARQGD
jgi:hypothetical protein